MTHDPTHFLTAGVPLAEAQQVMIMVHGRGGSATDILSLSAHIEQRGSFAFVAPQASGNTWYPHSFLEPLTRNEPQLSDALLVLTMMRARLQSDYNFKAPQLYWLGFSQGACLLLEFIARNPLRYGGVFGLSGGFIGPPGTVRDYEGTLDGTPVFLGCSDIDPHIPEARVLETEAVLNRMGASVMTTLYPNFPHSINADEFDTINNLIGRR